MRSRVDEKLQGLATLPLGEGTSRDELTRLGRLCDVVRVEEGTVLQTEGSSARYCWSIVRGAVAMSREDHPLAVASSGAWLLDGMSPSSPDGAAATIVAITDLELVVFGRREIQGAVDTIPSLARGLRLVAGRA
jgi:CRP-like cAMP-binding protein